MHGEHDEAMALCSLLKEQIARSLQHSLRARTLIQESSIPDHKILHPRCVAIAGTTMAFHELPIRVDEFYASDQHLLTIRNHSLSIYKYGACLNIKLQRKIESSYILYKRTQLEKNERHFLYRVFLGLVESNVYRYEAWFEAIMAYLDIDQAESVREYANGVAIRYRWGVTKYFDEYLNATERACLVEEQELLGSESCQLSVTKNAIRLQRKGSAYVAERRVGRIRQYQAVGKLIFILTAKSIIIAKFE